jgi:hypothetical protein
MGAALAHDPVMKPSGPVIALALLLSSCGEESSPSGGAGRADELTRVCVTNQVDTIPPRDELGFVEEPCLVYNREDSRDRRETRDKGNVFKQGDFHLIDYDVTPENIGEFKLDQLRVAAMYLSDDETDAMIKSSSTANLFELLEDPFFYQILDSRSGALYDVVNMASGDTPLEVAFEADSLVPVVVTEDGSVTFCRPELIEAR